MLYDTASDVVRKALRGLDLAPSRLADLAGVDAREVADFLAGNCNAEIARLLAPPLGLDPRALSMLPQYEPRTPAPAGVTRLELPFDDETVNAWLLERDGVHLVIDAGSGRNDLAQALNREDVRDFHLLITHGHHDHIGGIPALRSRIATLHAPGVLVGAQSVVPGDQLQLGPFHVRMFDLAGHHPQAVGYFFVGFKLGLLAVGDAVFAGSMGGCPDAATFQSARRSIESSLTSLPDFPATYLLTGHGPGTTITEELDNNPFLAAWNFKD